VLRLLYADLAAEERRCAHLAAAAAAGEGAADTSPHSGAAAAHPQGGGGGDRDGAEGRVRAWYSALYAAPAAAAAGGGGGGDAGGWRVRVVGPVGERPVHVCLLRAGTYSNGICIALYDM
jgi:hypothetical protein